MNNEWAVIEKLEYTGIGNDVKSLTVTVKTNSKDLPLQQLISGDMNGTRSLFDKLKEIAREPVRNIITADKVSDEDLKMIGDMLNRAPPIPICHGDIWPDDEEEEEMNKQEEQETQKWFMRAGMDRAVFCIVQEMMEDFDPNAVAVNILTDMITLYKTYARRKVPERVRNEVTAGLEYAINAIRKNGTPKEEEK